MTTSPNPANENQEPVHNTAAQQENAAPVSRESVLEEELARTTEELTKMRDQWIRAVADGDNIRKRAQREQEETARYAVTAFARDMVSVLDNLIRASENIPPAERGSSDLLKTLGEGVDLTLQELLAIFKKFSIERIDPNGKKFDHNFQQAVAQVERSDVPPGTVVQVVQAGYVIHDRLLRPAMVVVSKQPEAPAKIDPVDTVA